MGSWGQPRSATEGVRFPLVGVAALELPILVVTGVPGGAISH